MTGLRHYSGRIMTALSPAVPRLVPRPAHGVAVPTGRSGSARRGDPDPGTRHFDVAEFVHGHEAQWKAWPRYAVTHPPRNPVNLYPDLSIIRSLMVPTMTEEEKRLIAQSGVRGVFPRWLLADDEDRAFLDELRRLGMRIRIIDEVPSWVYADRGVLCALPLDWAEHPPSSIAIVTHPSITEIVSLYVESIWDKAVDYPLGDDGWEPVLRLLERGLSDAAVAQSLDVSPRTVHRRISEAMERFDVHSRFELGAAWARHRSSGGRG
ncbi:MAG: helix-turn-helix transcriptional regulator [Leifsonia sp.]